mmetsp:Transcript_29283/g.68523  ORF Transcript_29283/g.68523 Transcript_29283/m.68523 type:complete len:203 (+) Transcript_29283:257-865(+)
MRDPPSTVPPFRILIFLLRGAASAAGPPPALSPASLFDSMRRFSCRISPSSLPSPPSTGSTSAPRAARRWGAGEALVACRSAVCRSSSLVNLLRDDFFFSLGLKTMASSSSSSSTSSPPLPSLPSRSAPPPSTPPLSSSPRSPLASAAAQFLCSPLLFRLRTRGGSGNPTLSANSCSGNALTSKMSLFACNLTERTYATNAR